MRKVHYFQRYHTKENVETANTMPLLSRLYSADPNRFYSWINDLCFDSGAELEPTFCLQEAGPDSVPDAVIGQNSFRIVAETKLDNGYRMDQLTNHLKAFGTERYKVLLTLDPQPMRKTFQEAFEEELKNYNREHFHNRDEEIRHVNLTFAGLLQQLTPLVEAENDEMKAVFEDFREYCRDENLITDRSLWMRAVTAGDTLQENLDAGIYYDDARYAYTGFGYLGLYRQKSICAVGQIEKVVRADCKNGTLSCKTEFGEPITPEETKKLRDMMTDAEHKHGYRLSEVAHHYFFVKKFYEMDFRKTSPNGMRKMKDFDLKEMLGYQKAPTAQEVAERLNGRSWESFLDENADGAAE